MDFKKSAGALWIKTSAKGTKFMSGIIEIDGKKIPIVIFKNTKAQEKHPDYKIYISDERKEEPKEKEINVDDLSFLN